MRDAVHQKLAKIFRDVFDDESLVIADAMSAADIDGWDSLATINLVVLIEKEFSIRLNFTEVHRLCDIGDLKDLILCKQGGCRS